MSGGYHNQPVLLILRFMTKKIHLRGLRKATMKYRCQLFCKRGRQIQYFCFTVGHEVFKMGLICRTFSSTLRTLFRNVATNRSALILASRGFVLSKTERYFTFVLLLAKFPKIFKKCWFHQH